MKNIKTIILEDAKKAVNSMEKKCLELMLECSFCILDCMGNIIILEKMDNASTATLNIAENKARSALRTFLSTRAIDNIIKDKNIQIGYLSDACKTAIWGGFPLFENEQDKIPAGAIGVSGGSWEQDEEIAKTGTEAMNLINK